MILNPRKFSLLAGNLDASRVAVQFVPLSVWMIELCSAFSCSFPFRNITSGKIESLSIRSEVWKLRVMLSPALASKVWGKSSEFNPWLVDEKLKWRMFGRTVSKRTRFLVRFSAESSSEIIFWLSSVPLSLKRISLWFPALSKTIILNPRYSSFSFKTSEFSSMVNSAFQIVPVVSLVMFLMNSSETGSGLSLW